MSKINSSKSFFIRNTCKIKKMSNYSNDIHVYILKTHCFKLKILIKKNQNPLPKTLSPTY